VKLLLLMTAEFFTW